MIFSIKGKHTTLETICEGDSKEICGIRNKPEINKYLSSTKIITIEEQKQWIKNNNDKNDGVYFKIVENKTDIIKGTISLYNKNRRKKEAEFGRYICTSAIQAVEAELLIIKFGFEIMNLERMYCRTANENKKVWNQHYKYGFVDCGYEILKSANLLLKKQELLIEHYNNYDYNNIIEVLNRLGS